MKLLSFISNIVSKVFRISFFIVVACSLSLFIGAPAKAALITGDPVGNDFGWTPNSTNALNYAADVPGTYNGKIVPYVLFNSSTPSTVTLDFYNYGTDYKTWAYFEVRTDGVNATTNLHTPCRNWRWLVPGRKFGQQSRSDIDERLGLVFNATQYVDVRLALGGERAWDFDWTRFETAPVPIPGAVWLLGTGLIGIVGIRRKFKK